VNTDQQILAIVERGFTLPEGLEHSKLTSRWELATNIAGQSYGWPLSPQQAHDLCAMHFARQLVALGKDFKRDVAKNDTQCVQFARLVYGHSAAAIAALHAVLQPSGGEEE
jgi:hypothetical protein